MTSSDIAKTGTSIMAAAIDTILSKYANEITNSSSLRAIELVSKNIINSIRDPKTFQLKMPFMLQVYLLELVNQLALSDYALQFPLPQ